MTFWLTMAGVALALLWACAIWESSRANRRRRQASRDSVAYLDQWTAERRQRLADMQHPAPKGIDARRVPIEVVDEQGRRHTVIGHKERP